MYLSINLFILQANSYVKQPLDEMAPFRKVDVSFLCLPFYLQRLACHYILT